MSLPNTNTELLAGWNKRLREVQMSHYNAAKPLVNLNNKLGIPVVILTTIVGTSVFASINKEVEGWWKILVGSISVLAAILSGVQTFLKYSERAEKHRAIGAQAGVLRREIEQYFAEGNVDSLPAEKITSLRQSVDSLSQGAPNIPDRVWTKTLKYLEKNP